MRRFYSINSFCNYFPNLILRDTLETRRKVEKIIRHFPRSQVNYTQDLFTKEKRIVIIMYLPNIKEKHFLLSVLQSLFSDDFLSFNRIFWGGMEISRLIQSDFPDLWSRKNINYTFLQIFEKLINPSRSRYGQLDRDPTDTLLNVFTGKALYDLFSITSRNIKGETASYWLDDDFGSIGLDYPTLAQFFGRDFHRMQPALFYTESNLDNYPQPLSVDGLLSFGFLERIDHLYKKFYEILSKEYKNGQTLKASFHQDTSTGLHRNSTLSNVLKSDTKSKFSDLLQGDSFSITIQKQGSKIVNEQEFRIFVASITFYLVMFNSIVLI